MSKLSARSAIVCAFLAWAAAAFGAEAPPLPNSDLIPVKRVAPDFPREALMKNISGKVRVHFTVLTDGTVADVRVVESTPPKMFDQAAIRAVSKWQFKPRIIDGVATEREAEQTILFNVQGGGTDELANFAARERNEVIAYHARLRALCPDRYAHADDAANAALQQKLPARFYDALMTVEPKRQADADSGVVRATEICLFTSWEQLRNPQAYEVAAFYIGFGAAFDTPSSAATAFIAVAEGMRAAPAAAPTDAQQIVVRRWLFRRFVPAYYSLINAQATQLPPAKATGAEAIDALDRAKAAMDRRQGKEARSILTKALKTTPEPIDRALLLLALARTQDAIQEREDAIKSLEEATMIVGLPWNLVQTAEMARASLCSNTGDSACFEASRAKLHAELGLTDKFVY